MTTVRENEDRIPSQTGLEKREFETPFTLKGKEYDRGKKGKESQLVCAPSVGPALSPTDAEADF